MFTYFLTWKLWSAAAVTKTGGELEVPDALREPVWPSGEALGW